METVFCDWINDKVTSCLQNIALSWLHSKKVFLTRFLTTLCGWGESVFLDEFSLKNRNLAFFVASSAGISYKRKRGKARIR